jgi:hypothetical protein
VDLVAWHADARAVLIIELKTEVLDFGDLLGTLDRRHRLAAQIVEPFDWSPTVVGSCLLIADSMTNRRRVADHAATMRAALPGDGHDLARWLRTPVGRASSQTLGLRRSPGARSIVLRRYHEGPGPS